MNTPPYFITWTKQNNALTLPIDKTYKHYFKSNSKKIFDFSSISFQTAFGLRNSFITNAIAKQSTLLAVASPKHTFPLKDTVSKRLLSLLNLKGKIFFTLSGAEGIENAIKISRIISNKKVIACRKNSYHGATLGAISCSGDWRNKNIYNVNKDILRIPEPNDDLSGKKTISVVEKFGPQKIAAFCLETITGGNGVIIANKSWWRAITMLCKKYKIQLILDEVVCGFFRTGKAFGFQHYSFLKPDYIVMAKAMTGGFFPLGALFVSQKNANYFNHNILSCGLTNYAHPIGLAASNAVLNIISKKQFLKNLTDLERLFKTLLNQLSSNKKIKEIRSIGMMCAIDLKSEIPIQYFLKNNFYLFVKNNTVILMPHLNLTPRVLIFEFQKFVKAINDYE